MDRLKKVFGVLVIVLVLLGVGYAIYSAVSGTRKGNIKTVAKVDDQGLTVMYGDLGTDIEYIEDPTVVNYGVKQYPGSTPASQKELSFQGKVNSSEMTVGTFVTQDSVDKVVAYYKSQLGETAKDGNIYSQKNNFDYKIVTSDLANSPVVITYRATTGTVIHLTRPGL